MGHIMSNREQTELAERAASRYIAQRETGPWTQGNALEFEQWLRTSPLHRVVYYRLNAAWQEAGRLKALGTSTQGLSTLEQRDERPGATRPKRFAAAAGTAIALIAGGYAVYNLQSFFPERYSTVVGGLQAVPLPDGSRVTLNTDSTLRVSLNAAQRRIDLDKGEAFFEVAKDPLRPFVVTAGKKRIIAIGTQFSVRRDGDEVRVAVTEGTVRYEGEPQERTKAGLVQPTLQAKETTKIPSTEILMLAAGTTARSEAGSVLVQQEPIPELEQHLTWRSGVLTFDDTPLQQAVTEFNRYNARKIVIRDAPLGALRVGGIFRATKLEAFVHLLEGGFPIRVTDTGDTILLTAAPPIASQR